MKAKHLYRFGEFTLNAEDHSLTRNGDTVPVTPKMFDLLLVLVQHPGRVLGKDFLLKSVWPDSFVEEGNITFNIRQLRKALDDNVQSPIYIENIPRRGYRFLAPVETSVIEVVGDDGDDATSDTSDAEPDAAPQRSRRSIFITVIGLAAIAVLVIGWFFLKKSGFGVTPILAAQLKSEKLSTDGGVFHIAISPDGKNVVYTHRTGGKQSIWLRQLETSNNVPIVPASDDFYGGLAISPDGNSVYFVRGSQTGPQLSIYRMPIFGGVPQKIIDGTQGWISLSGDGKRISFVRCPYTDDEYCSLFIADASDGQNEKKLASRPRPVRIGDNKISPDGKTVAFAVGQSRTSSNEFTFAAVDVETGVERAITSERFFNISYIVWLPDQSGFLITALQLPEGNYRIWHIDNETGAIKRLTSDSETYSRLSLDARGAVLVSTQVEADFRLMLFQTDHPTAPPVNLGNANTVSFSPDGKLYFSSQRTGDTEVWSANADGSDMKQLTNNPAGDIVPMISPDLKTVFFQSNRTGKLHIWRMNPDGTNQKQVTTDEGGVPLRVSPDGQWLYYRSALNNTLRRAKIDTGDEELILPEMGRNLALAPDITRIAYSQRTGRETVLTVYSIPEARVIKAWTITSSSNVAHLQWSDDGTYLAYVLTEDASQIGSLWFQTLDSDSPKQIADLSGEEIAELAGFSLSADGKSFALIKGNWKHDAVLFRGLK